eukprot:gene29152-32375_t
MLQTASDPFNPLRAEQSLVQTTLVRPVPAWSRTVAVGYALDRAFSRRATLAPDWPSVLWIALMIVHCGSYFASSISTEPAPADAATPWTPWTPEVPSFDPIKPATFYDNNNSYMEEYRIRGYEVNPSQETHIITIANYLQEIASNYCVGAWGRSETGYATPESMVDRGFVMARLQIRMFKYPKWNAIPVEETRSKLPDIDESVPQIDGPKQVARRSDMDMNGHINNVMYIAWVMEGVPKEVYEKGFLYEIEIDFKAECHAGQSVEVLSQALDGVENGDGSQCDQYLHVVKRCDDENKCYELIRARTTWKK